MNKLIYILAFITLFVWGFYLVRKTYYLPTNNDVKEETIIKIDTIRDTITVTKPEVYCISKVKTIKDTLHTTDTIINDSLVVVDIPIEQKTYRDSSYYAVISGFKASLDTLKVFPIQTTITKEIIRQRTFLKRFTIGIQGGYGYSIRNNNFTPYIGFGLTYNLW